MSEEAQSGPTSQELAIDLQIFFGVVLGLAFLRRLPSMLRWLAHGGLQRSTFFHAGQLDAPMLYPFRGHETVHDISTRRPGPNVFQRALVSIRPTAHTPLPGMSVTLGQFIVLILSATASIAIMVWGPTNPIKSPNRSGFAAIALTPAVVGLGLKNSLVGGLGGWGYEKLNRLHRLLGRLLFLFALLHTAGYLHMWIKAGKTAQALQAPSMYAGLIAMIGLALTAAISIPFFRSNAYNLFWHSHWIGFWTYLVAICYHVPIVRPWIVPCVIAYLGDIVLRWIRTRTAIANVVPHTKAGYTTVTIPSLRGGWEPGQHVYLRVHGLGGMFGGLNQALEKHPVSIASSVGGKDGLRLIIKSNGDWSGRLLALAQRRQNAVKYSEEKNELGTARVWVEGPYGGPFYTNFSVNSYVVFVAAGSGLAFVLSCAEDLVKQSRRGRCRTETAEIVFIARDIGTLQVFQEELTVLMRSANLVPLDLRLSVYLTRPPADINDLSYLVPQKNVKIHTSRPLIAGTVENALEEARRENNACGLAFGICGPPGVVRKVRAAIGGLDEQAMKEAGGVSMHCETFAW